jgi:PAT family beta-lactamase induction signal transducer AmpG
MIALEVVLSVLLLLLAQTAGLSQVLTVATILFIAMGFVAATHDVAIDGYYLEALDEKGQSEFVGYRAAAWRVAAVASGGGILAAAGTIGWWAAWMVAFVAMVGLTTYHWFFLPTVETRGHTWLQLAKRVLRPRVLMVGVVIAALAALERQRPVFSPVFKAVKVRVQAVPGLAEISTAGWIGIGLLLAMVILLAFLPTLRGRLDRSDSDYARAFVDFLEQPKVGRILALVVLFRVGESFLLKMRYPFLRDEVGMSTEFFGIAIVGIGSVATIIGTMVGGHLIARDGLRRWLWPFVVAQNLLNLLYMAVALLDDPSQLGPYAVSGLIMVEHLGAGLGTAVFMVYIMRCCDPRHRATHMAILTALMSIGFSLAGTVSGFLAAAMGYELYFGFTFLATFPAMGLLFFVPHLDGREEADSAEGAEAGEDEDDESSQA